MATASLIAFICFLFGFAMSGWLIALRSRRLLYRIGRFSLRHISHKLLKKKPLLFRHKDEITIKSLDELLDLLKQTSLLLKGEYKGHELDDHTPLQVYAYVDDCKQRSLHYFKLLDHNKDKPKQPYIRESNKFRGSCYFCSQPILFPFWNQAGIHLGGEKLTVPSCSCCKEALSNSYKVNTLCFESEGRTLHWSQCEHYYPQIEYWNINQSPQKKPQVKKRVQPLKLVYSQNIPKIKTERNKS